MVDEAGIAVEHRLNVLEVREQAESSNCQSCRSHQVFNEAALATLLFMFLCMFLQVAVLDAVMGSRPAEVQKHLRDKGWKELSVEDAQSILAYSDRACTFLPRSAWLVL